MPNTKEEKIIPEDVLYDHKTGDGNGSVTPTVTSGASGGMSAKSYAQWLYSQSLSLASEQRKQLVDASEITRKRSIADANSSYMKSLATYGQNAEKMASMGLSGSGYGEYLTSQAYAQKRSTVQNANAQHLATEKEAIYQEKVAKQEALSTYHANMLQAQAEQNNAYNSLLSAASSGASIESIMASGQWGLLGADQQTQIKNIAQSNSFKLRIDGGESIEDIMADANYNTLSADAQQSLQNYYQTKQKNDANAAATAYTNFINMLRSGAPLTSIQGMLGYDLMTQDQLAEFARIDAYNMADALLKGGKTLAEIEQQNPDIWSKLGDVEKANLQRTSQSLASEDFESDTRFYNNVLDAIAGIENGTYTFDQVKEMPFYKYGIADGSITEETIKNMKDASAYRTILAQIQNGDSFADIKSSEAFTDLGQKYQDKLEGEAGKYAYDKISIMLDNKSLDEIKKEYASDWELLTPKQKGEIEIASKEITEAEKTKQLKTFTTLSDLINRGTSLKDIQSGAWAYLYESLDDDVKADLADVEKEYKASVNEAEWLGFKNDLENGTMTIDVIKKLEDYASLSEEQKKDLESFDAANKIKDILDNSIGTTLDDIKKDNKDLWDKVAGTQYERDIVDHATGDASNEGFNSDTAYDELLKRWKSGNYTADAIRGQEIYKHLNKSDLDELEKTMAYDTNKKTVETRIANGDDWRTIVNSKEYKGLNADDLGAINNSLNERAQKEHDRLSALIQSGEIKTQEQLEQAVNSNILFNTEDVETDKYIDSLIDELDKKIENDNKLAAAKDVDRMLNGEYSWADIENSNAYQDLDEETKDLAQEEYDKALDAALDEMIDDAISTGNLDYIKGNAWYDNLSDAQKGIIDQAINDYNLQHNIAVNENKGALKLQISGNIADDAYASLNDLRNEAGFSSFSKKEQANFEDEWIRNYALSLNQSYSGVQAAEVAKLIAEGMNDGGYDADGATKIMEYWQKNILKAMVETLNQTGEKLSLAEAEELVNMKAIPKDSIDYLRRAGVINSSANSIDGVYDNFNSGKATADEVISQSGVQTIGRDNIPDVSIGTFSGDTGANFTATINGTSYNVATGYKVTDDAIVNELNKLATGNENTFPTAYIKGGDSASIVLYEGKAYIYTSYNEKPSWKYIGNRAFNQKSYNDFLAALIANQK